MEFISMSSVVRADLELRKCKIPQEVVVMFFIVSMQTTHCRVFNLIGLSLCSFCCLIISAARRSSSILFTSLVSSVSLRSTCSISRTGLFSSCMLAKGFRDPSPASPLYSRRLLASGSSELFLNLCTCSIE